MKTMQDYTVYCTEEHTRRAYALGAPLETSDRLCGWTQHSIIIMEHNDPVFVRIPTTQQMIGWLREKSIIILPFWKTGIQYAIFVICNMGNDIDYIDETEMPYKEQQAELAAIDVAMNYIEKGGKL